MSRTILHSDLNSFYASVECLYRPELRDKPVAVGGSEESRHGIILAANRHAKKYGVRTAEALWQARQKCPHLVVVPPNSDRYQRFSLEARRIYSDYSPCIESFGLDECFIDLTGCEHLFGSGKTVADEIRRRIKFELGITASVGVSFNKIFAKLGSDMKKPDATTVIMPENYRETVWSLPVSDLLYIGPATTKKLARYGILTIGDLARSDREILAARLGKWGLTLWSFANGYDLSPVAESGKKTVAKSIGNSTTTAHDLRDPEDIKITVFMLAESVAARLREQNCKCRTLQVWIRYNDLSGVERQDTLPFPSCTAERIGRKALELILKEWSGVPCRSLGVRAQNLVYDEMNQLSLLPEIAAEQERENLEYAIDHIRGRYGAFAVRRGMMLTDERLSHHSPKDDHVMTFPTSYFK